MCRRLDEAAACPPARAVFFGAPGRLVQLLLCSSTIPSFVLVLYWWNQQSRPPSTKYLPKGTTTPPIQVNYLQILGVRNVYSFIGRVTIGDLSPSSQNSVKPGLRTNEGILELHRFFGFRRGCSFLCPTRRYDTLPLMTLRWVTQLAKGRLQPSNGLRKCSSDSSSVQVTGP